MLPIDVAGIFGPIAANMLESYINSKILKSRLGKERSQEIAANVADYSDRTYRKLYYLKTIIFQNDLLPLTDLYHPLKVINVKTRETTEINSNCMLFLDNFNRMLITDYAGMGKSTISKFIYLTLRDKGSSFPIFIELRRIKDGKSLYDLLKEDFGGVETPLSPQALDDILSLPDIIVFFDGFDEIPLNLREESIKDIIDISLRYPSAKYLITSRSDSELVNFTDFTNFSIEPLETSDVESILRKYDPKGEISELIIEELRDIRDESFHEILSVPMMVTLLFRSFGYNREIPSKKYQFYKQVYEALYNGHDLTKEGLKRNKESGLDIDEFQNVLRAVAFQSAKTGPSYSREDLVHNINKAFDRFGYTLTKPSQFISDILQAVPLFSDENVEIRWIHKSLQDYFAAGYAAYIISDNQKSIFEKMFKSLQSSHYANIIELSYDMKPHVIEEAIILPYLKDYLNYSQLCEKTSLSKEICDSLYQCVYVRYTMIYEEYDHLDSDRFPRLARGSMPTIKEQIDTDTPTIVKQMISLSENIYHYILAEHPSRWILDFIGRKYEGIINKREDNILQKEIINSAGSYLCAGHNLALQGNEECALGLSHISMALFRNEESNSITDGIFQIDNERVKTVVDSIVLKVRAINEQEEF